MIEKDAVREDRIHMDAVVDAYGPEEQAMGWYYYLDDKTVFVILKMAQKIKNNG